MNRVVLDTNIYISALHFQKGNPRKILEMADDEVFRLLISKQIIAELRGVLSMKFGYPIAQLDTLENLLLAVAELVEPKKRLLVVRDDPDDNKILECAYSGNADFIVSGDSDLLRLRKFKTIKIVSSSQFLEQKLYTYTTKT